MTLLVQLALQGGFNLGNLFGAEFVLNPADDHFFGQVSEGDHVAFGTLQAEAAVGATGVDVVSSIDGVVGGKDVAVAGLAVQVGDTPGKGGVGHG